jgi:hypothetical protein
MPVKLETRINEEARKAAANHTNDEQQTCNAVFHAAKVILSFILKNDKGRRIVWRAVIKKSRVMTGPVPTYFLSAPCLISGGKLPILLTRVPL